MTAVLLVVCHLLKKSGNFGWSVNGKANYVFPNEKFPAKKGFLESWSEIPKWNFQTENVRSFCSFLLFPGLLTFMEMSVEMKYAHPMEISIPGFDAPHLLQ